MKNLGKIFLLAFIQVGIILALPAFVSDSNNPVHASEEEQQVANVMAVNTEPSQSPMISSEPESISLDSAWPGFVLGVLAILTTVLIGFQIKSTIDIDSKFDEQRKNLENLIAAQAEKIIVPNFKITRLQSLSAKLTSVSYSWNKYERAGDGIYFFRSTFEACFRAAKDIMMDDYVSDNIKSNVPMICADTLTSLVVAKNNGIIDDDFLVSEDVMIKWLIETAPEVLRSSYYNHLRSNNGKDTL